MVGRWRFLLQHIQGGAGQRALLQGEQQRGFVDKRPAGRIEQQRAGFEPAQLFSAQYWRLAGRRRGNAG